MALTFGAFSIFQQWFGPKKDVKDTAPAEPAKTLVQAFAGIDPKTPPALDTTTGAAELKTLTDRIAKNETDEYSYWARLRSGLIQQYVFKKPAEALKLYDQIINQNKADQVHAQAIYQKGDMQWKLAQGGVKGYSQHDGAVTLEKLIHQGRGSSQYLDQEILVPVKTATGSTAQSSASNTAEGDALTLPSEFALKPVKNVRGTLENPDPQGVLDRVNEYYKTTFFYKIFDGAVKILGNNPATSYGIAIIFFALLTRLVLQPLNKRQYESMKGMTIIAPEMKKIQQKYEKKKDQQSQMAMVTEIRELQKRHGVSPMLGCVLALVQLPVFFFVVYPFIQHYEAKMELAGASFLWIPNLAHANIPLLVLYSISQFVSIRLSSVPPTDEQQRQMQLMTLFFPFVMPFFLLTWPSAFTLYWMTFNVLSTFFQYRMMKAADPTKTFIKSMTAMPGVIVSPDAPSEVIPSRPKSGGGKGTSSAPKTIVQNGSVELNGKAAKNGAAADANGVDANGIETAVEKSEAGSNGGSAKKDGRARRRRRF